VLVKISTRHGHLSEASQQNISAKAEKVLRIFDRITAIELTIDLKDSNLPRVDAKLSAEHRDDFIAHDQSESLMASIDTVLHRLEQQMRKYKEKITDRHRNPDARRDGAVPITDTDTDASDD
jgi:putative sigma-54 modulation protein